MLVAEGGGAWGMVILERSASSIILSMSSSFMSKMKSSAEGDTGSVVVCCMGTVSRRSELFAWSEEEKEGEREERLGGFTEGVSSMEARC